MIRNATSKRVMVPFILRLLVMLMCSQVSAQPSDDLIGPLEASVFASLMPPNSVVFTVKCLGHNKFTDGTLSLRINIFRGQHVDTVLLWSGNSDTDSFDRTFNYIFPLAQGKKAYVAAKFSAKVTVVNRIFTLNRDLSIYNLPDTLLQTEGEYNWLDWKEIDYLIKKKGYERMSEDEIRVVDPKFWKRIMEVKHGHVKE